MCAEPSDYNDMVGVVDLADKSVVIALDVEDDAPGLQDTCLRMRRLNVLGVVPLSTRAN